MEIRRAQPQTVPGIPLPVAAWVESDPDTLYLLTDPTAEVAEQAQVQAQAWRAALATLTPDRSAFGRRMRDRVEGALVAVVATVEALPPGCS